jgi:hypothetical protein
LLIGGWNFTNNYVIPSYGLEVKTFIARFSACFVAAASAVAPALKSFID